MAYVNKYVTDEEKEIFIIPPYGLKKIPVKWTIDKEKDVMLCNYHTERDYPDNKHFIFAFKGNLILIVMNYELIPDRNMIRWSMRNVPEIPDNLNQKEVMEELKKAIIVYGCTGSPNQKGCNVVIDF